MSDRKARFSRRIPVCISEAGLSKLEALAQLEAISQAAWVRMAIEEGYQKAQKEGRFGKV